MIKDGIIFMYSIPGVGTVWPYTKTLTVWGIWSPKNTKKESYSVVSVDFVLTLHTGREG